jgi:PAS domain S-box-containing protein
MADPRPIAGPGERHHRWTTPLVTSLAWMAVIAVSVYKLKSSDGTLIAVLTLCPITVTIIVSGLEERRINRLNKPVSRRQSPSQVVSLPGKDASASSRTKSAQVTRNRKGVLSTSKSSPAPQQGGQHWASLTRSGLYDAPPSGTTQPSDVLMSGSFTIIDMVNRLDPQTFRWIESSLAEQEFLGWTLDQLRRMTFLEVLHHNDRARAEDAFRQALVSGEFLGLVVGIRTAAGKAKMIEVNAGARYGADQRVSHLRCHVSDVTEKVRAERELRLRTIALTQVNEQLRQINRELVELKDRYTDLYENAPAMYFTLDQRGLVVECNETLLTALDRRREELIGESIDRFLDRSEVERWRVKVAQLLQTGAFEVESRWTKASGEQLNVWISGRVAEGPKGQGTRTRCVAQDRTAKHRLEAELRAINQSLARANTELSQKNRELDEFVYVVSHDLQEPLRTLVGFSDYLLKDHAHRLDAEGQEFVKYLFDASHRMRAMIYGLLKLSRAGKVTGEFGPVDLGELAQVVQADLGELIRSRGALVKWLGPDSVLWGDPYRLHQLLANLVSNAVKYNRSAVPRVEIGTLGRPAEPDADAEEAHPSQTFFVRDNGIGIDRRFHETVFQLFRRLNAPEEYEGSGVGLAICSKIVAAHRGRIWVESQPGNGSTFFVSLPTAKEPAQNDE